jgi:hypothetical protein
MRRAGTLNKALYINEWLTVLQPPQPNWNVLDRNKKAGKEHSRDTE